MDIDDVEEFWQAITVIEAQQALVNITTSSWSSMKQESQNKIHRNLSKMAYPKSFSESRPISSDDLKRALSGG